jgi:hypothetical protein
LARLRNEDYVAFLDESIHEGPAGFTMVAGLLIPARILRSAERRWRDFISDRLCSRSGRREVKSKDLTGGHGAAKNAQRRLLSSGWQISVQAAGWQFYREALQHIAGMTEIRVLTVGFPTPKAADAYHLWFLDVQCAASGRVRKSCGVLEGMGLGVQNYVLCPGAARM